MWRLRFWIYVLVVAISLAQVRRVVACSCMNSHPQTLFCNSDFGKEISHFERNKIYVWYIFVISVQLVKYSRLPFARNIIVIRKNKIISSFILTRSILDSNDLYVAMLKNSMLILFLLFYFFSFSLSFFSHSCKSEEDDERERIRNCVQRESE